MTVDSRPAVSPALPAVGIGLALAIAAYLLSFFHRVAPAAIAGDLQATFAIGGAQLGTLAATYFYVYTVMQVPTGVLADTLGPRSILFWGGIVAGIGGVLFALAPGYGWAMVGRTLVGLGVSVTFIAALKIIAIGYHESRFATLTGVLMLLGNLGSILAGVPLAWATQAFGWRGVFIAVAVLSVLLAFASRRWVVATPRGKVDRTVLLGGLAAVVRNRATWPGFFVNFGIAGSALAFGGLWAVPYLTQMHGMSRATASLHVSAWFAGIAVGSLVWGKLSDALGKRRPVMVAVTTLYVLGWGVWLSGALLPLFASIGLCFVMGAAASGFSLSWAAAKEVNPPQLSGMSTSVVNVGVFLGAALLQPIVGWLMERHWDGRMDGGVRIYSTDAWQQGMLLLAGAALLGWLAAWFVRETGCRNIWQEGAVK